MDMKPSKEHTKDGYVPVEKWGRDHWSTLAYFRSVEIDRAGFLVKADPRMRMGRYHYRVLKAREPAIPMTPEYGSRLNDDTFIPGHDDIHCISDFAEAGLLTCDDSGVEPGETLHLSPKGVQLAEALLQHKASGGSFSTFKVPA